MWLIGIQLDVGILVRGAQSLWDQHIPPANSDEQMFALLKNSQIFIPPHHCNLISIPYLSMHYICTRARNIKITNASIRHMWLLYVSVGDRLHTKSESYTLWTYNNPQAMEIRVWHICMFHSIAFKTTHSVLAQVDSCTYQLCLLVFSLSFVVTAALVSVGTMIVLLRLRSWGQILRHVA